MPTGYTAAIKDGITFKDFVMRCARNFGACITMWEDPADAVIPDEFLPSDYYAKELGKAKAKLAEVEALTLKEAATQAEVEYKQELASYKEYTQKALILKSKYSAMLQAVETWQPPTSDHQGLKDFMVSQITQSIDWDCDTSHIDPPKLLTPQEWITKTVNSCLRSVNYYTKQHAEEVERCKGRTEWIRALRKSMEVNNGR